MNPESGIDQIFKRLIQNKEVIVLADSALSNSNLSGLPFSHKIESYFDSRISIRVVDSDSMQVIGKIQMAKKAQIKIENWDQFEIENRLQKLKDQILIHSDQIATIEAHFQGTSKDYQMRWAVQPVLNKIEFLLENKALSEGLVSKGLIGGITPKAHSFYEIGWRVLYSIFHKDALLIKPATEGVLSSLLWLELLKCCDLPSDLIAFVYGEGKTIGRFIMDHPGVRHISFSGAFETLKSYSLSLEKKYQFYFNGKNSVGVLADFDFHYRMPEIVRSFIEHNGKSVFSPSRLFVLESFEKEFISVLKDYLQKVPNLNSIDDHFGLLPLRSFETTRLNQTRSQIEREDAKLIFGNDRFAVYSDLPNCSEIHQENLELPVFSVTAVKYSHEIARWANNNSFGHSFSIFGSPEKAIKQSQKSEVGKVFVNPNPLLFENVVPVKSSSFGDVRFELPNMFYSYFRS